MGIPANSGTRYIEAHIPQKVRRPLLNELIGAGVLECDGVYYFGHRDGRQTGRHLQGGPGKCLCYRLGEAHRRAKIRPRPITHPELLKKLAKFNEDERAAVTDDIHLALREWHDRVEVLLGAPYGEHLLLDRMMDGERRFTVCKQGRVHTNMTNLPRQYPSYQVSRKGEVRSLVRNRVLAPVKSPRGYLLVNLYKDGKPKNFLIHRLVAAAFIGPIPEGWQVNHKDADKENNALENLEIVTRQENYGHARAMGLLKIGEENGSSRLTEEDVRTIRQMRADGVRVWDIAHEYGVSEKTIYFVCRRLTWKHVA